MKPTDFPVAPLTAEIHAERHFARAKAKMADAVYAIDSFNREYEAKLQAAEAAIEDAKRVRSELEMEIQKKAGPLNMAKFEAKGALDAAEELFREITGQDVDETITAPAGTEAV